MCKVTAISMPQINWGELARVTEVTDGESVLRLLDRSGVESTEPKAVPMAMGWDHIYYTFAVELNTDLIPKLIGYTSISWTQLPKDRSVLILSASLKTWQSVILEWLRSKEDYSRRVVGTQIYNCFRGASIMQPWADHKTERLQDNTTILRR